VALLLDVCDGEYAVCRLPAGTPAPAWFDPQPFAAISWAADETTLVCRAGQVPAGVRSETGWRALKLRGPFAFELTGILAQVLVPLAQAGVGIFAVSTFDTDYVLIKQAQLETAIDALIEAGHAVHHD